MLEKIDFCWNAQVSEVLTDTIHIVHVPPTLNTQATIGRTLEATIGRARRAREGEWVWQCTAEKDASYSQQVASQTTTSV